MEIVKILALSSAEPFHYEVKCGKRRIWLHLSQRWKKVDLAPPFPKVEKGGIIYLTIRRT